MSKLGQLYPEIDAGGFSRADGSIAFYSRVTALLEPNFNVLDYGAGRGQQLLDTDVPYRTNLSRLQGKVSKVVGADIDEAVLENPFLDERHVIKSNDSLPFSDETFDLICADWVLEHVTHPDIFVSELDRVLKPGGWFCARTPNRWGMTGLATNLVPNRLHTRLLGVLQPEREEIDVFPTAYRLNTRGQLRRRFPNASWQDCSFIDNGDPPYVQSSVLAMRMVQLAWRLLPSTFHTVLYVFMRKRPQTV